jgi:hypothetical protein
MAIDNASIATSGYTNFEVPVGETWAITTVLVCNRLAVDPSGANDREFSMYIVLDGEAENDNKNLIVNTQTVQGADTFIMDSEKIILEEGDKLSFTQNGGSAGLNVTVSYINV